MDERRDADRGERTWSDIDEGPRVGFIGPDEFEQRASLEMHTRHRAHDRAHVDLRQEEYTPEEVARLIGTSLEVVMHAIWNRELKANRQGGDVICISHADVVDWLRRRGGV